MTGQVISTKMTKTISVEVARSWTHPLYQKRVKRTKTYLVHDQAAQAKVGDQVRIIETRPLSRRKRFRLDQVISHGPSQILTEKN